MCAESALAGFKHTFSGGSHSFVVVNGERSSEDIVEVPIDDDVTGKDVAGCPFDRQTCRREEAQLTIFQTSKVQNALCTVLQKHEDKLLESLRAKKYQYGCGLMTLSSLSFGRLGTVNF